MRRPHWNMGRSWGTCVTVVDLLKFGILIGPWCPWKSHRLHSKTASSTLKLLISFLILLPLLLTEMSVLHSPVCKHEHQEEGTLIDADTRDFPLFPISRTYQNFHIFLWASAQTAVSDAPLHRAARYWWVDRALCKSTNQKNQGKAGVCLQHTLWAPGVELHWLRSRTVVAEQRIL